MKISTYKKINKLLFGVMFIAVVYSLWLKTCLIAFFAIGFYMVLISFLKTRVAGVLADERQQKVSGKAAQVSFQILLPILLLTSVALTMGAEKELFGYTRGLGIVLSYITCLGVMIYVLSYWYFDKKTGGRE